MILVMFCPECRAEYGPGFTRCSECDVDLVYEIPEQDTLAVRVGHYLREQGRLLFKLVGIPVICASLISLVSLYLIGGTDLLRFAARQLFTWRGVRRALIVVGGLTLFSWLKHLAWYQDEPPPLWFRRSVWLNVVEGLTLLAVIVVGIWAFRHWAPPPLP